MFFSDQDIALKFLEGTWQGDGYIFRVYQAEEAQSNRLLQAPTYRCSYNIPDFKFDGHSDIIDGVFQMGRIGEKTHRYETKKSGNLHLLIMTVSKFSLIKTNKPTRSIGNDEVSASHCLVDVRFVNAHKATDKASSVQLILLLFCYYFTPVVPCVGLSCPVQNPRQNAYF